MLRRIVPLVLSSFLLAQSPARGQARPASDAAILSLLDRVTTVEIECTSYAAEHAGQDDIRTLARRLRDDHGTFRAEGQLLAERLGLALDPKIRSVVADSHAAVLSDLHMMSGPSFDRTFVDHEIGLLQFTLTFVTRSIVPAARDPEVRRLLDRTVPLLKTHLELARAAKRRLPHG